MEKIRLANGNTYEIEGGASEHNCSMFFADLADAVVVIKDFTKENLAKVEFLAEGGEVCGTYEGKILGNAQIVEADGGHRVVMNISDVVPTSDEILNIILGGAN